MKIKTRILWALLGMFLVVALVGGLVLNRLNAVSVESVTKEAQDVARVVSLLIAPGSGKLTESAQEIVEKLHQTQGRNVVVIDPNQFILADASPAEIGKRFSENPGGEIAATIRDRQVRTFLEVGRKKLAAVRRIVVPVESESGQILGAVVLEYTPLYSEMTQLMGRTILPLLYAGLACVLIGLLIALDLGRSIVKPLRQLTSVVTGLASGQTDLPMPPVRKNEIGELVIAFNNMVQKRLEAEEELRRLRDELEARVNRRTAELARANEALRTENAERKRVEIALRETDQRFHQLADNITDVFWMTSPDLSQILYVSPGYERIWGRSIASLVSHPEQWAEAILPEDRDRVAGVFATLTENAPEVSVEFRVARPDGSVCWVCDRGFQVRDAVGKLIRLAGIASDITERKQSEEALKQQQTELRVLFDLTPAMIFFKDTENRILRFNKRFADTLGDTAIRIEGLSSTEAQLREAKFYADDLEVIRSGVSKLGIIETIRHLNGQELWVQTDKVPVFDQEGKVSGIVVMCQDITERRRDEQTLRLLNSAVLQSKEAILITDAELDLPGPRVVFVNPAFTTMTGYTAEEIIGKTPRILQGPQTDKTVLSRLREDLESGQEFAGGAINYRKSGQPFDSEWQIAPIRNTDGTTTHYLAIQRDITVRKRFEAQLFQSQKMETVAKLAGGVAHEFNSILTAIIGQSEILIDDLPEGTSMAESATEINKAAGRAAILTRQLLAYGRKQLLQPEILDLNLIIADMNGVFHHLMGGAVDIQVVPAAALQAVQADAGQVEQVIMNMIINARDAMPNGGKLTLETANVSFDQESVDRYPELKPGDYVMLAISDTGTGMSAEVKARLFEPFFSTKEIGHATGLGLSTCYGIIKQSGGHISVYSELARGATFKIYLPQVEQRVKNSGQRPAPAALPRGTETILLVEDDPALREMAATLLRRLGYTVLPAANGIEALSLRQQRGVGHIDLLFTDIVMPHMSGKELSERVVALYPHTRVLFTSAYTEHSILHQGVLDKGLALLQKPFTPHALAKKLREVLDQPNPSELISIQ
jgi:two-component system, cell cycle sensor histidine kinase and response regulator CckA